MDYKEWKNALLTAQKVLDQAGVEFWFSHGTLLGLMREGRNIDHDNDIDISFMADKFNPNALKLLFEEGFRILRVFGFKDSSFEIQIQRSEIKMDLFFYYKSGIKIRHSGFHKFSPMDAERIDYFFSSKCSEVESHYFSGIGDLSVSKYSNLFLKQNYGNWKEVVKSWDYSNSPRNKKYTDERVPYYLSRIELDNMLLETGLLPIFPFENAFYWELKYKRLLHKIALMKEKESNSDWDRD
jgi:LicD family